MITFLSTRRRTDYNIVRCTLIQQYQTQSVTFREMLLCGYPIMVFVTHIDILWQVTGLPTYRVLGLEVAIVENRVTCDSVYPEAVVRVVQILY
jgi:hypothetical protein